MTEIVKTDTELNNKYNTVKIGKDNKPDLTSVSEDQKRRILAIKESVDITNSASITTFGSDLQTASANQSTAYLDKIRTMDTGGIGDDLTDMLNIINTSDLNPRNLGMIKRALLNIPGAKYFLLKVQNYQDKFNDVNDSLNKMGTSLEKKRLNLIKDITEIEVMQEKSCETIIEVNDHIAAGQLVISELKEKVQFLRENNAQAFEIKEAENQLARIEKKTDDFCKLREMKILDVYQHQVHKAINDTLSDDIESQSNLIMNIWRDKVAQKIALDNTAKTAEILEKFKDATNNMIIQNSKDLTKTAIKVTELSNRSLIDIKTLDIAHKEMEETVTKTLAIVEKRRREIGDVAAQLARTEKLDTKLLK